MLLRPYQTEAVAAARRMILGGKSRVLLVAPTGGGKTVIFSSIAKSSVERGKSVIVVAHRRELITQASEKLDAFGVEHGVILAKHPRWKPWEPVQVASIQTLTARAHTRPKSCDLIIYDEAHHTRSATSEAMLKWYPNAVILGVTATPWRSDNRGLGEIFQEHHVVTTPRELLEQGYLVPATGFVFESPPPPPKPNRGDYTEEQLKKMAKDVRLSGDVVDQWRARANNRRTVVFAVSVDHSKELAERFTRAGVRAEHVDGETELDERKSIIQRLRAGETRVVCNVNVLTEGTDIPELECIVLARPTLSLALYLQMIGRGLRPSPETGKRSCLIHDHAGCVAMHGGPFHPRDYSLSADIERRKKSGGGEASEAWRVCKQCLRYNEEDTFTCMGCGAQLQRAVQRVHENPDVTRVIALEDVELPEGLDPSWTPERKKKFYERTAAQMLHMGRPLGVAAGVYKKKFGQFPPWSWTKEVERWWKSKQERSA